MAAQMISSKAGVAIRPNNNGKVAAPNTAGLNKVARPSHVCDATKSQKGRWKGMDAGQDMSDDQQDIARGRGMVDSLFQGFQGTGGTQNAIMSSSDYISTAQRNFNNIEDGFYISPAFLDKISIHVAKNFMDLPKIKVPLILGIWGGKGQGKTFQCMLAFKKLGITPIVMSAGELESGNAGEPAKLIRQRYREASDIIKKGKMCALFINDLDAGAGRFGLTTQYTVNNQMVNATLMNIADNPTNVQLPGVYKNESIPRVPIICTGNDFSTLYAPLIRDGRMEKFYWNPTREDRVGVCMGIFADDGLNRGQVEELVDGFPGQSIDFFGALRARVYDDMVRKFVDEIGHENLTKRLVNSKEGKVKFEPPKMGLEVLVSYGKALVMEQDNVRRVQLADAYLAGAELAGSDGSSVPETYEGASEKFQTNLNNAASNSAGWRTPVAEAPKAPAPAPRAPAPAPTPATPSASSWRFTPSSTPAAAPAPTPAAAALAGAGKLSAGDLSAFKADDLNELCRKKGVTGGKSPTRESLTEALVKAGVSLSDLSRGQLVDLGTKLGKAGLSRDLEAARRELSALVGKGGSAAAAWKTSAAPAPSSSSSAPRPKQEIPASWRRSSDSSSSSASSGGRFASYAGRSSSSSGTPAAAGGASTSSKLSAGDLVGLRIDDLRDLVKVTGTQLPREPTKQGLIDALVANGVTLTHCTRGMLVDLSAKLGAPMAKDAETMRRNLASLVGKGAAAAPTPSSSWRSTPAPAAAPAAAAPAGGRFSSYSAGASDKAPWRRSGSYTASSGGAAPASGLSAADLASLRIDDLRDISKKIGAVLPRDVTKDGLISALLAKGVTLNSLPRAALVDLCARKGVPTARDAETMKKNLASKIGGAAPAAAPASSSSSSWRSTPASTPAAGSTGGRFASYGSSSSNGWRSSGSGSSASGGDSIYEADLASFKIDDLTTLARKVGIEVRNATKESLVRSLASKATVGDLSKGNLVDILSKLGQSISGSVEDLRSRVRAAAGDRQAARATAGARR